MKHRSRPIILIVQAALILGWQAGYAIGDEDSAVAAGDVANDSRGRSGADWDAIRARAMSWLRAQASAKRENTHARSPATAAPALAPDVAQSSEALMQQSADAGLVPLRPEPEPEPLAAMVREPILHEEDAIPAGHRGEPALAAPTLPQSDPTSPTRAEPNMPALPREGHPTAFDGGVEVASADLDNLRGGFEAPTGQQFYFGITRTVYVNGDLIATQTINLVNAALARNPVTAPAVTAPVAPTPVATSPTPSTTTPTTPTAPTIPTTATNTSQTGTPSTATASSAGASSTVVVSPGSNVSVTQGTHPVSSQATAVVVTPPMGSAGLPSMIVQNGAGNMADISSISQSASPLILQNTLNNQSIRTETTINATVPSLSIMGSINQMRAINEAIRNAATNR